MHCESSLKGIYIENVFSLKKIARKIYNELLLNPW